MASPQVRGAEAAEFPGATPATRASPARPTDESGAVVVIAAPPQKTRHVWRVGKEGFRVDSLCMSAVTAPGARLPECRQGDFLSRPQSCLARPDSVK